jgi:DNA-binding NarL/FixJ family response regulator
MLVDLLSASEDISVVAECSDGDQVVAAGERSAPDVFILDLAMPRMSGLQAARALLSVRPDARIILLTANVSAAAVKEAQEMGLAGYLLKGHDPDALVRHVRTVASGGTAWGDEALASVTHKEHSSPSEPDSRDHGERRHDEGMPMAAPI